MSRIRLAQSLLAAIAAAWPATVVAQLPASGAATTSHFSAKPSGNAPAPITSAQFERAAQIAKLAAEQGMHELSMRAIRRALANGPPVDLDALPTLGKPKPRRVPFTPSPDRVNSQVSQTLETLAASWRRAPPEDVYQTLLAVVLPEGRPGEIFLYDALAGGPVQRRTRSRFTGRAVNGRTFRSFGTEAPPFADAPWPVASRLLVEAASRAARMDDLQQRAQARDREQADFAATILLTQLALGRGHPDTTTCWPYLQRLAEHNPPDYARWLLRELTAGIRGPETPAEMIAWLEAKLEHETRESRGLADDQTWLKIFVAMARWRFARGDVALARRHLRRYAEFGLSGDADEDERERYLTTRWLNVAREFIAEGQIDDALDALAVYVDSDEQVANEPLIVPVWLGLRRQLMEKLPAAERYERLACWTIPDDERPRPRFIGCFVPRDGRPDVFQTDAYRSWPDDVIASSFQLLVAAASEARQLDDLKRRLAAFGTVDDVQAVALAVLLAEQTGDEKQTAAVVDRLITSRQARLAKPATTQEWISEAAYLLIHKCLRSAHLRRQGAALAELSEQRPWQWINRAFRSLLKLEQAAAIFREFGLSLPDAEIGLAHWVPVHAGDNWLTSFAAHAVWAEDADCLRCVGGGSNCALVFDCPLVGQGEISADLAPKGALGNIYYGGVSISPFGTYVNNRHSPATLLQERRPSRTIDLQSGANRLMLHVEPEISLALIGGEILCDVPQPSPAAPWLMLSSSWLPGTGYRRLTIAGDWRVPREVELIADDRLTGWISGFYEAQPSIRRVRLRPDHVGFAAAPSAAATSAPASVPAVAARRTVSAGVGVPPGAFGAGRLVRSPTRGFTPGAATSAAYFSGRSARLNGSWSVVRGLVNGMTAGDAGTSSPTPSRLTYFRPLRNGDELRYEFRCQPRMALGSQATRPAMMVHPALDRLTFLLEPDGVRLHWMTNHPDLEAGGLPFDNVADEPAARRGPARLPLVDRDWNRVALKLIHDEVLIELNGELILKRRLEDTNDRRFSFFHYQDQTHALVRNVVLSGNWPDKLPPNEELFARLRPLSEAERAAQAKLVGAEQFESDQTEAKEKTR